MFQSKSLDKLRRTREIIRVFTKYGLDYLFDPNRIGFLAIWRKRSRSRSSLNAAESFCMALTELGPTFIKFGQILSTRPDFLPPPFIRELEKLQDRTPPFDSELAKQIVEQELKKPVDDLFRDFDTEPLAAASLSQVHKATLPNGDVVAVKIQRPDITQTIELDLAILEDLAGFVENRIHNGWNYRPGLMVAEFKKAIRQELDFSKEAHNFEKFRDNFRDIEYIDVPKVYWDRTTKMVLTMEFIDGVKINEITQEKYKGVYDPELVANRGAGAILKQVLEDGFFHADPHPGNLFVQPPAHIVMLDVGMVGRLDKSTMLTGAKLLKAVVDRDTERAMSCLEDLRIIVQKVDSDRFRQDLAELFDSYLDIPLKDLDIIGIAQDIMQMMTRYNLTMPSNLVLMVKAVSMIESVGRELYPDLDILTIAKPYVGKISRKRLDPRQLLLRSEKLLQESVDLVEQLPQNLNVILHKAREGKFRLVFDYQDSENLNRAIESAGNRISLSMIISTIIVVSTLIVYFHESGSHILGYPTLGVIGYLLAFILCLFLLRSVLRSKNRRN